MSHYTTLEIDRKASSDEIKTAYKRLASRHHPDKGGDTAKFQEIQKAYEILGDVEKRRQYDAKNDAGSFFSDAWSFGDDIKYSDLDAVLKGFRENVQRKAKKQVHNIQVHITLAETLAEMQKMASFRVDGNLRTYELRIPAGITTGTTMRYEVPEGTLQATINVIPHDVFTVDGADLYMTVAVGCLDVMIGAALEITTISEQTLSLKIPAGSQSGTKFKIPKHGLPIKNSSDRGSLYVVLSILIPTDLTAEQLELATKLRDSCNS